MAFTFPRYAHFTQLAALWARKQRSTIIAITDTPISAVENFPFPPTTNKSDFVMQITGMAVLCERFVHGGEYSNHNRERTIPQ